MRHRLIAFGIIGFWLVMMGTLVRRWVLEVKPALVPGTYRSVLTPERRHHQWRMGIFVPDGEGLKRVGQTQTVFDYQDGRYKIDNATSITMPVLKVLSRPTRFDLNTQTVVSKDFELLSLTMSLRSELVNADIQGRAADGKLVLRSTVNGQEGETFECAMPSGEMVIQGLSPLLSLPPLSAGMRWKVQVIDPTTLQPREYELAVLRRERLRWEGEMRDTHVVEIRSGLLRAQAWIAPNGDVLQERTLFGVTFIRERVPGTVEEEGK